MIDRDHQQLSLVRQCILLDVSRASVYYRPVPTRAEDLELMALMDRQYLKTPFYGSRKMKAWLLQQGYLVSRKRVRRLMRLMGLEAIYRRPNTSKPAPGHRIFPYLLKGVEVNRADQVWAADITYIPMAKGFLYLVAIMDWHSRHVLAWKLSNTMDTSFCVAALEEALGKGRPEIFNTDQGSQFTSEAFTQTLQEQRVQVSMDGKGRYLDNIFVERLWRSIKYEEVYLKAYQTVAEARTGINAYLEFYNRQRPHQALGYRTPAEVYQHGQEERGAAAEEAGLPSGLVKPSAGVGDSLKFSPHAVLIMGSTLVIRFELSPGGKGCGFLFKRTGVRLPYYRGKNSIKAHCPGQGAAGRVRAGRGAGPGWPAGSVRHWPPGGGRRR